MTQKPASGEDIHSPHRTPADHKLISVTRDIRWPKPPKYTQSQPIGKRLKWRIEIARRTEIVYYMRYRKAIGEPVSQQEAEAMIEEVGDG